MNYRGVSIKLIFWCLGVGAFLLSGCTNANRAVTEPAPQRIVEAAAVSVEADEPAAVAITEAAPGASAKPMATKSAKSVAAFDMEQFRVARTLELPYYNDTISSFVFSPDGKTVAGVGRGVAVGDVSKKQCRTRRRVSFRCCGWQALAEVGRASVARTYDRLLRPGALVVRWTICRGLESRSCAG